jgi:hypothetical protein
LVNDTVTSKVFFIDKKGNIKLQNRNFLLSKYSEGLINCSDNKGNWGFIDIEGNSIIDYKYKLTSPFFEGKAAVAPKKDIGGKLNRNEKYSFINQNGDLVISKLFEGADIKFSDGLFAIFENDSYGYINDQGIVVIPCNLHFAGHFSEGFASFKSKGRNRNYGFINKNGEVIIEEKFKSVESFKNGLAKVIIGQQYENFLYGYINKVGNFVWEPTR